MNKSARGKVLDFPIQFPGKHLTEQTQTPWKTILCRNRPSPDGYLLLIEEKASSWLKNVWPSSCVLPSWNT